MGELFGLAWLVWAEKDRLCAPFPFTHSLPFALTVFAVEEGDWDDWIDLGHHDHSLCDSSEPLPRHPLQMVAHLERRRLQ